MKRTFVQRTSATKTVFREGAVDCLRAELSLLQVRRPLLVCSGSVLRSSLYPRLKRQLSEVDVLEADAVPAHSSVRLVEQLARTSRAHGVDGVLAAGGGSASDTAKAVALLLAEGGALADHATQFTPPASLHAPILLQAKIPVVTVPCTASGAEVTPSLGIRDADGRKLLFSDPQLASRVVLLDAQANLEVPSALMLSTGMNGVAHCIEGLYSKERSPLAELLALDALRRFAKALPAVHDHPGEAAHRGDLLYAAHLSGLVLVNARTCLHHAICHAIGSVTGAPHGQANAVMLPHALEFNGPEVGPQLQRASSSIASGEDLAGWVRRLAARLAMPTRLRDIGIPAEALEPIAAKTMGERGLYYNPRSVTGSDEILHLLKQAF